VIQRGRTYKTPAGGELDLPVAACCSSDRRPPDAKTPSSWSDGQTALNTSVRGIHGCAVHRLTAMHGLKTRRQRAADNSAPVDLHRQAAEMHGRKRSLHRAFFELFSRSRTCSDCRQGQLKVGYNGRGDAAPRST